MYYACGLLISKYMQPDIVIKNRDIILGTIQKDVLLKYSKLIQKSLETLDDYNGKLIAAIDIQDICDDINKLKPSHDINWIKAIQIVNVQEVFMDYCDSVILDKER